MSTIDSLSDLVYDEEDADEPLLVKEARILVEKRLKVGRNHFFKHIRPILDRKPLLPGGKAKRIRKGDVETLCNLLRRLGPDRAQEIVEQKEVL